ncbi:MAG TPA: LysR substrate-binding domain-containing protein [Terriglobales bacterium]|nr:LysR substrate-binding domain-containing protein [Terriglobales bacterium]
MTSLRRLVPSPSALFVFEASARYLSFTQAAGELSVTQSAVSRMIARFEAHLGARLFHRSPTGIELTEEGRQLYAAVTSSFQRVEMAIEDIRSQQGEQGTVTMSISSAFAMHWVMPRLPEFESVFPQIDLRFQVMRGEPLGPVQDVDFGIRYDAQDDAEHLRWPLLAEEILPVCSPDYLRRHGPLGPGCDMSQHALAHLSGTTRLPWSRFLATFDLPNPHGSRSLTFSDYALTLQAAISGRAIALGWRHVVSHALHEGSLVPAGPQVHATGRTYYLVASSNRPLRKPAVLVRDWLLGEMALLQRPVSALSKPAPEAPAASGKATPKKAAAKATTAKASPKAAKRR